MKSLNLLIVFLSELAGRAVPALVLALVLALAVAASKGLAVAWHQ